MSPATNPFLPIRVGFPRKYIKHDGRWPFVAFGKATRTLER